MVTGVTGSNMTANVIGAPVPHSVKDAPAKNDRRSNKPIMEKRRRARINNCLNELKALILDATKKDPARHSKLEKADILEKTVKHLQELQRQQAVMQQAADPKVINKFRAGFTDCANEVSRFPGLEPAVKRRLLQHLSNCINGVKTELHQQQRQLATAQAQQLHAQMLPSPPSSPEQDQHSHSPPHSRPLHRENSTPLNPYSAVVVPPMPPQIQHTMNGYFLPNGVQVIPTKLPNGNIALVLPQNLTYQQQQQQHQLHHQQQHQHQMSQHTNVQAIQHASSLLVPVPKRTASTSSASSHSSSTCERHLISPASVSGAIHYAPPSPANSYEAMDCKPSVIQHAPTSGHQHHEHQHQQPLSLVVKKDIKAEQDQEPVWRPW